MAACEGDSGQLSGGVEGLASIGRAVMLYTLAASPPMAGLALVVVLTSPLVSFLMASACVGAASPTPMRVTQLDC
jgi:hypothetical protein